MFLFPFFFSIFYFIHPWCVSISLFFTFQFSIIRTIVYMANLTCLYLFIVWLSTLSYLSWVRVHMCLCLYLCIIYFQICLCPFWRHLLIIWNGWWLSLSFVEQPYDSIPNFSAADALRLTGIGRNEFIDIMNKCRSKVVDRFACMFTDICVYTHNVNLYHKVSVMCTYVTNMIRCYFLHDL